ncbi:N-methyl-L-tryptophan oxidase [Cohnella terricola]|uniref:N-methyl-L-tryptophan oxidase n=1 Tax=Cohnella terricola TaxID=1289167 RepID=A0A559J9A7_9BACL|nr:N-methyl-L-tryptophan oxidase [Cohnella terricola]TVX96442.1 N-methyl-L-tryptophan oxidase [Cohnella terricola]
MTKLYDVIVVGAGSMGMSAGYELSRRGLKTLLIDAFAPPHTEGSHHGDTRLIRHVYSGGPTYVKLALRADERWRELEEETGEQLLVRAGVLNIADPSVYSYEGRFRDAREHGVTFEELDAGQVRERWPGVQLPERYRAMYEPDAGYLYSDKCVAAYKKLAIQSGAKLLTGTFVKDVVPSRSFVTVVTDEGEYMAHKVVVSAGAWFKTLEPFVRLPIRAVRKVVAWFEPSSPAFDEGRFPGFTFGDENGGFYGFPSIAGSGVKIGRHDGGEEWRPGEPLTPFGSLPEDEADLRRALGSFIPGAAGKLLRGAACKYEHTPDEHFIIDTHPVHPNVLLAGGFSGHGFKFASAVGELLANKIELDDWGQDIGRFAVSRFSLPEAR